jgi:hypothetical protein
MVAKTTRSTSSFATPAAARAFSDAASPRSEVAISGVAKWRSSTPLLSRIHSSLVSRMRAICALVTRVGAISLPLPTMTARVMKDLLEVRRLTFRPGRR